MKLINKAMRYIYYKFYVISQIFWGKEREPHINAVMMISATYYAISLGFLGILSTIMDDVGIFDFFYDKQYILMIYGALLFTIAYFQFSAKQKYRKIYKEFKNEPRGRRIVGNILATLYFFGSIGFMMWIDKLVRILIR